MDYNSSPTSGRKNENFHDHDSFEPIKIACDMENDSTTKTESTHSKLTMVVMFYTNYIDKNGK